MGNLDFSALKRIGVVLKRAQYFLTCKGKAQEGLIFTPEAAMRAMLSARFSGIMTQPQPEQLSLFDGPGTADGPVTREDVMQCLTGQI